MPEIQLTATADVLDTPEELFELLKELQLLGWRGSVQVWAEPVDDSPDPVAVWRLQAHVDDAAAMDGTRSLQAGMGDVKVVIGSTYSVMSQAEYDAAYGSES